MEVTKNNFTERLEDIQEAIEQATFLSIDGEFTGLEVFDHGHCHPFDTVEERYNKLREGSLDFLMVQFGVCAFKFNKESQSYEARPFNFYIFPRPYTRQAPDRRFLCQSSSIEFLVQQGFDFNKVFREGIPYLTPSQEDLMREALKSKHEAFAKFSSPAFLSPDSVQLGPGKGPVQVPPEQKAFMAAVCNKVNTFLESSKEAGEILQLAPCSGFQRKLIYQTIRTKFSSVHLETKTGEKKERYIVLTKVHSEEDLKKKEKEKQNAETMELEEAVGFSKVVKMIAQSKSLLVGHNMLLDVMHLLSQFLFPLPQGLEDFKYMVKGCLPRLLDTKLMASTHPFRDLISNTSLGQLEETLNKKPFTPAKVELPEEFSRYQDATDKYHEAGYDAYVTGCMFATMTNYLGKSLNADQEACEPTCELLQPFTNKLFLMRIADVPYLNISGQDLQPNRDHIFHLQFPRDWKSSDINNLFGPYGNIQISWLTNTSAFVSLYKKDNAKVVLKALGDAKSVYKLLPYQLFKSTPAASPTHPSPLHPPSTPPSASPQLAGSKRSADTLDNQPPSVKKQRPADQGDCQAPGSGADESMEEDPTSQQQSSPSSATGSSVLSKPMFTENEDW